MIFYDKSDFKMDWQAGTNGGKLTTFQLVKSTGVWVTKSIDLTYDAFLAIRALAIAQPVPIGRSI